MSIQLAKMLSDKMRIDNHCIFVSTYLPVDVNSILNEMITSQIQKPPEN